ncbi:MAG: hypothetical protein K9H26_10070 [Prolixibacteraceae bacterium]|nr:hypothetical protein [Prolixibacteraceae bacterium]
MSKRDIILLLDDMFQSAQKIKQYTKDLDFDSVKMMREIRDKHHVIYESNPQLREDRLAEIRIKYAKKIKSQETANP